MVKKMLASMLMVIGMLGTMVRPDGVFAISKYKVENLDAVLKDDSRGFVDKAGMKNELIVEETNRFGSVLADKPSDKLLKGEVVSVSLGFDHSGVVTKDGNLYMWGRNECGQVGNGTTKNQTSPVKVLDNVASVSLGGRHSGAITKDGGLYMWGWNKYGEVGNGTLENQVSPVKVLDNVAFVSLESFCGLGDGIEHYRSGAITKDGSLYIWGEIVVDNGTTKKQVSPMKILDNVASVSFGAFHSGAITKDGSLYMWGWNYDGQVGNGTREDQMRPVKVLDNVTSVSLGESYSGAITRDGSLYMWGYNGCGQVGNGEKGNQVSPVKVLDNVSSVSLKEDCVGAITKDGSLYMWGQNISGKVGNGKTKNQEARPVKVLDNVASVSLGFNHSGAVMKDGSLYMWGDNYRGQVGDGTGVDQARPVKVLDNVGSISLGEYYSGALMKDGSLYMWGYNCYGQVGNGTTESQKSPVKIIGKSYSGENSTSVSQSDEEINLDIYKANRYMEKGTPSNNTVQSMKGLEYPSQILVDALNKDHGSFEKKVMAWKAAHYAQSPSDILNGKLDEKGYYEAIILSIFVSQSDSSGFVENIVKKANSEANSVLANVSAWVEKSDSLEASKISKNQILSTISPEDQAAIREHCAGLFAKNHPLLDNASFITDTLGTFFTAVDTIGEAVDRMSAYVQLSDLSLQQKAVLKKMYELCPSYNITLKGALIEVVASMDSFDSGLLSAYENAALGQGANVAGVMINDAWKAVITANPYAAAFQAGASAGTFIGDKVCSTLFSTDKTIEQYQKMKCLGEFNQLLQQVVEDFKSSYLKAKTSQNARNYLESVETVFAVAYLSCDFAKNYGDIVFQDALVGQIVNTVEDVDTYTLAIERTKQDYNEIHAILETDFLAGLEIDYPQIYKEIMGEKAKEETQDTPENLLKKINVSVSRGSFYIATQKSRIKINFPNGRKPDEYEKCTLKSSNPKVAVVDKDGWITGKKKGKSMITVKIFLKNGSYKQVKFQVVVHEKKATVKKVITTIVE